MSPDKSWKALERRVAHALGTTRTPLSGGSSGHTRSDTLHPQLFVEIKYRKRFSVCTLFSQVRTLAQKERKVPVLVLHEANHVDSVAVISYRMFARLYKDSLELHELRTKGDTCTS